ncbi:methyltransferase domain-containing protein [Hyphobacterium sp. CCMP332]|nr:methyltransferase domain-containing protein [Hyphobacterium sp. CCMP332]
MFKQRSSQKELMDDLNLASDALKQNLRELEMVNSYLGGYKVTLSALKKLKLRKDRKYRLIDIGSGAGDMLKQMAKWANRNHLNIEFAGLDANQFMIDYAAKSCSEFDNISFLRKNIFEANSEDLKADIVTMNLFCHHFSDKELSQIINLISDSEANVIIINDLHRHPLAYYSIWFLTRLLNGSYLVQHDAPLSVKRAFKKNEIRKIFVNTSFKDVTIVWNWAFRWQVSAFKNKIGHF